MSKVIIDLNGFVHLEEQSSCNCNYYKHKEHGYTILQTLEEGSNILRFYKKMFDGTGSAFLFSCEYLGDNSKVYEGDLGFFRGCL